MRMRDRSSVERIRMALTEKRDILGDMMALERGCLVERRGGEEIRRKERGRKERGGAERRGEEIGEEGRQRGKFACFPASQESYKGRVARGLDIELYSNTLAIELVSTRVGGCQHPSIMR